MAGLDGSTKKSQHVMNANFKTRTAADVASGGAQGEHVFPRGPTLSSKGGGKGGAVAQKDFLLELQTLDEAKKRLDEWREEYSPPLSADKIPDSKEVTHAKTVATINNDGEATARAAATEIAKDKKRALVEYLGEEQWDSLSPEEQALREMVCGWACHDHIRALFSKWGVKYELQYLDELLSEDIDNSGHLRPFFVDLPSASQRMLYAGPCRVGDILGWWC
jgi:hypothetical protein